MAATGSYGDITLAGVGTVTSVCGSKIVGFGHPMNFFGSDQTYGLAPASVIYVQEDKIGPAFKVSNIGAVAGTVSGDHITGISGVIGPVPATMAVSATTRYGTRVRTGTTQVQVPQAAAAATYYQLAMNHDLVIDGRHQGSELATWRIEGTFKGRAFSVARTDRTTSVYDVTESASMTLPSWVDAFSSVPGVSLRAVSWDGLVTKDVSKLSIKKVFWRKKGAWVRATETRPIKTTAGKTIRLRVQLANSLGGKQQVRVKLAAPSAPGFTSLDVVGNYSEWGLMMPEVTSFRDLSKAATTAPRSDTFTATLAPSGSEGVDDAPAREMVGESTTSQPLSAVVSGYVSLGVMVR